MVVHTFNPRPGNKQAGRLGAQGHLQLYCEFKTSLGYIKLSQKTTIKLGSEQTGS